MAHVVITGGAGFLGSHLCDALRARGDRVTAFDNLSTGNRQNIAHLAADAGFAFHEADVCEGLAVEGPVDAVLHFASPASPVGYLELPIETLEGGGLGTHQALRLAKAKGASFLLASTSEVYGDPTRTPQPEEYWGHVNPIGIRSCYDEAKRYAEAMTAAYRRVHGLDTQIVRIFNTYGPRMDLDDGRVLPTFLRAVLRGEPLPICGDGLQTRSFCHVQDTVRGILTVLARGDGLPVNIGCPGEVTILAFARLLLEVAGSPSPLVRVATRPDDPQRREPSSARARARGGGPPVT
ncbi:MAG: NAD-dependent epimerase/dehydratase family protein, partial [Planctomycetota bacterium]|nr:NAD-dependent epimerase/dehydratase family protein [Planctomycetota bacterium]